MKISTNDYRQYKRYTVGNGDTKPSTYDKIRDRVMSQIKKPAPGLLDNWPTLAELNRGY